MKVNSHAFYVWAEHQDPMSQYLLWHLVTFDESLCSH